jgi:hypothetical protein
MTETQKIDSTSEESMKKQESVSTTSNTTSPDKISGKTVMYLIYLLYKENLLTRDNLGHIFKIVKDVKEPEDITKYLVEEEAKR